MTTIGELVSAMDDIAPFRLQESYDNAQLLTGDVSEAITGVLCTLDCLEETVEEAVANSCNVIVAHHPIVFSGLKKLTGTSYIERTVIKAIRHHIAILAVHTNLDSIHPGGVNSRLADIIGLSDLRIMQVHKTDPAAGLGLIGELPRDHSTTQFLEVIRRDLELPCIKYTPTQGDVVRTVAICGGSGSSLLAKARTLGAHAFVTSDFKYHQFFDSEGQILICDIGHYESEKHTIELLQEHIRNKFHTFAVRCTEVNTNPVRYHI